LDARHRARAAQRLERNGEGSFACKNNHSRRLRLSGTPGGLPLQYRARCPQKRRGGLYFFKAYTRTNR